jgi:hypothetical protein
VNEENVFASRVRGKVEIPPQFIDSIMKLARRVGL